MSKKRKVIILVVVILIALVLVIIQAVKGCAHPKHSAVDQGPNAQEAANMTEAQKAERKAESLKRGEGDVLPPRSMKTK